MKKKKVPDNNTKKPKVKSPTKLNKSFEDDVPLATIAKVSLDVKSDDLPLSEISKASTLATVKKETNTDKTNVDVSKTKKTTSLTLTTTTTAVNGTATSVVTTTATKPSENTKISTTKVKCPLPDGLNDDILEDISKIKVFAESFVKGKFFRPDVNAVLLQ